MSGSKGSTSTMSDQIKKISAEEAGNGWSEENCVSDALLLQFLEGATNAEETEKIQAHLNACAVCSHIVGAVYYNKTHPFTPAEQREAKKLIKRSPEEQVARLFNLPLTARTVRAARISSARAKLSWLERLFPQTKVGQFAFAMSVVLFVITGQKGVQYYRTEYQIERAAALLQKEHRVYYQDVRLSGGYASRIGITMGPGDEGTMGEEQREETYVDRAKAQVEKAVANGAASVKARRLLAQVLLIAQDARADSLVRELEPQAKESPELANDLGVYYYARQNWSAAESYFALARSGDPRLRDAYFNLALAKTKLGKNDEAVALLQECLGLETDEGWKRAALSLQAKVMAE
jgi:tetratricopeptide (TPR) repeat protein